uniref:RING-type domain-containing protein n=1 Tax=Palpitomonas bilix TaxID=652834 RepID=A0A7S3CWP8_9EUKA
MQHLSTCFSHAFFCLLFGDELPEGFLGQQKNTSKKQLFVSSMSAFLDGLCVEGKVEEEALAVLYDDTRDSLVDFPTPAALINVNETKLAIQHIESFLTALKAKCSELSRVRSLFVPPLGETETVMEEERSKAIGCTAMCPCCKSKCSQSEVLHNGRHSCFSHKVQAFGGVHKHGTKKLVFDQCCNSDNFKSTWVKTQVDDKGKKTVVDRLVFPEYAKKYYSDWSFVLEPNTDHVPRRIKRAWMLVGDRIAKHYGMDNNTPSSWKIESKPSENYCGVCLEDFSQAQKDRTGAQRDKHRCRTPCKHYFHVRCIVNVMEERRDSCIPACPVCKKGLDLFNPWL